MESNYVRASLTRQYVSALLAPAVIAGVMQVTWPFFQHNSVSPFLLAVIFCAWYGGLGPGMLSIVISFLLAGFFFIEPYFSWFPKQVDLVRLLLFAVVGPFISVMSELMHRERRRARINLESTRRAERSLREKERFANQIAELSPVVINVFDLTTRRDVYISPDVVNLIGYTPAEIAELVDPFSILCHPEDVPMIDEKLTRFEHLKDGEIAEFEFRIRRRDGHWRWVASRVMPFERNDHGDVRQIVGATHDITERKQAEEALRGSETRFRRLLDSSITGVVFWSLQGKILDANDLFLDLVGYTREDLRQGLLSCKVLTPPEYVEVDQKAVREMLATGACLPFEKELVRKDGSRVSVLIGSALFERQKDTGSSFIMDITERKRVEEKLRQSESQLAEAQRLASVGSWNWEIQNNTHFWSDELYHIYGLSPLESDPSYEGFIELVHRDDRAAVTAAIERTLKTQEPINAHFRLVRPDGAERIVHSRGNTIIDIAGTPIRMHGTLQDVTDRKHAEEALRESEERYRELFENAKDAIYVQDLNGVYTSVNRAAEKLSGYDRDEIIGRHFDEFVAPEYLGLVHAKFSKKLADQAETAYEIEVIAKDGLRVPVELSTALVRKHGVPVGIQGIARDITERKRAKDDLKQQKEILQKIFDHIPVMIRLAGPEGDVRLVNREYERTTGWSLADIQKNNLNISAELYPDRTERQAMLDRVATAKGEWEDFRTRVRDGRVIDTSWTNIHLSAGMSLGIGQDISERKRAEETLRSYSRQLIEAQEAERQHIARELHDQIGQVLTAIRINLQTIGNSCETAESRPLIDQGVGLIDAALEQVRSLSFELRPSLLDNLGLVAALRWYSDQYAQRTGIRTRSVTNLPEGQTRLKQDLETACFRIVQEALTNVVRHANAKNVSIDLRKLDHKIVLSIKDDGSGFDERSPNGDASVIRLGLRGMEERALALGGTLEIKSAPAQGTEICACFPT